jgi:hypothetical protein
MQSRQDSFTELVGCHVLTGVENFFSARLKERKKSKEKTFSLRFLTQLS